MLFTPFQRSLILALVGVLGLAMAGFRSDWFWSLGQSGAWLYNVVISVGCGLTCFYGAKLMGIRGMAGLSALIVAELAVFILVRWIVGGFK